MSGDIFFGCHNWDWTVTGIWWVEARHAAKYPTLHKTAAMTWKYPAPNVNNAEIEKPWSK